MQQSRTTIEEPRHLGQFYLLDAWRGIAALAVVCYHWSGIVLYSHRDDGHADFYRSFGYGACGVPIFFVISGFCIVNAAVSIQRKQGTVLDFLRARFSRIYPAYWPALILSMAVILSYQQTSTKASVLLPVFGPSTLGTYVSNLFLLQVPFAERSLLEVSWSLSYEMYFYFIMATALGIGLYVRRPRLILNLLHAITTITLLRDFLFPHQWAVPFDLWPHFGLGILVYDILAFPSLRLPKLWFWGIIGIYVAYILRYDMLVGAIGQNSRISFLVAALFAISLPILFPLDQRLKEQPVLKILTKLGLFSYSLYLTHLTVLRVCNQISIKIHVPVQYHPITFAVAVISTIVFAFLFYKVFEEPLLRKAKKGARVVTNTMGQSNTAVLGQGSVDAIKAVAGEGT